MFSVTSSNMLAIKTDTVYIETITEIYFVLFLDS